MNKVELMGRLTRDVDLRQTQNNESLTVGRFTVAVNRKFKNANGEYDADFISCVAFGKTAEFVNKYFKKGDMTVIIGRIQTGSYVNKDGVKVYTTDVIAEEIYFCDNKKFTGNDTENKKPYVEENIDEGDLPF